MSRKPISIEFVAKLPYSVRKQGNWYVSCCPILDVYSQGTTKSEAKNNLKDALSLFLISCFERNTLDAVLRGCGFSGVGEQQEESPVKKTKVLNVPIPMKWNESNFSPCHA